MSQALRKLTSIVAKSKTCLIFINQLREKIGVMFGNPETTTGGRAPEVLRLDPLDIRRIASLKEGDGVIGSRAKVKVVKNKVAPPFARPSSTSSTARASARKATCSTWRRAQGDREVGRLVCLSTASAWARAARTRAVPEGQRRTSATEIDRACAEGLAYRRRSRPAKPKSRRPTSSPCRRRRSMKPNSSRATV
jgi:hypothetical protein